MDKNSEQIREIEKSIENLEQLMEKYIEPKNEAEQSDEKSVAKQKKRSLRRSVISVAALLVVTLSVFTAQTYAYFVDYAATEENRIVAGTLDVELVELQNSGEGEIAYVNPVSIMPGTEVSKIVKIKNAGDLPVYVRIKIEKTINKEENEIPSGWEELITCKLGDQPIPGGLWTYRDGYYYYSIDLAPGSTTAPLFNTVAFSETMGNEFANSKIAFKVISQATQSNGNSDSPLTAWGWPPDPVENSTDSTLPTN